MKMKKMGMYDGVYDMIVWCLIAILLCYWKKARTKVEVKFVANKLNALLLNNMV